MVDGFSHRFGGGVTYLAGLLPALAAQPTIGRVRLLAEPGAEVVRRLDGCSRDLELEIVRLRPAQSLGSRVVWEALRLQQRTRGAVLLAPAAMLPRRLAVPVVAVPHNALPFQREGRRTSVQRLAIIRNLNWATATIFVSEHMRQLVGAHTSLPPLNEVIHHGLAPEYLAEGQIRADRSGIVCVADSYPHKRLDLLVAAWRGLGARRPSLKIIGRQLEGSPAPERGLTFITHASPADVADALRGSALAVLASAKESFGFPALESLACGTPLVASDIPAYREVTGGHATFVAGSRAEEWTAAIDHALRHPPDISPGQRWASRFTWARCANHTARVLGAADRARRTSPRRPTA